MNPTLLETLQHSTLATLIDGSRYILMVIQGFHLLALVLLLGLVFAFNVRVQGLLLTPVPLASLARSLSKPFAVVLTVAVVAGVLLALPRSVIYSHNSPFMWKMGFLLGGALLQTWLLRRSLLLPADARVPWVLRGGAALALVLWLSTGMAGRAIGFV